MPSEIVRRSHPLSALGLQRENLHGSLAAGNPQTGFGEPQNLPGLYEIALANYARAMYDCYNKGKYSVQVGCFRDEKDAKACQTSMADLGEDVIVKEIDTAYCVLTRYYFDDWDSAASYGAEMNFSDDCGVIFVRLL